MPRVSRQQTQANRAAITEAAARLIRERGIDGLSVSDLMASAGLTHGGFYGHFESKQALAASACRTAFDQSVQRWKRRVSAAADAPAAREALIEAYLSKLSRSSPGTSCPATALAADVARQSPGAPVRDAYCEGIEALLEILTALEPGEDTASARRWPSSRCCSVRCCSHAQPAGMPCQRSVWPPLTSSCCRRRVAAAHA